MIRKRLKLYSVLLIVFAIMLVSVMARICIFKRQEYSQSVAMQRTKSVTVKKYRGIFYDCNMIPLVEENAKTFYADDDKKMCINTTERYCKTGIAEHIIGYINSDGKGVSGLEKCFDSTLVTQKSLKANVLSDASGKIISKPGMGIDDDGSKDILSVKLTLDSHIQKIAEKCMDEAMIDGAVVILDVKNSDVLAMVSRPGFDRNNIADYLNSHGTQLVNRCISQYNAGSIFKIITATASIEYGIDKEQYYCSGAENIGGRDFSCHKADGHGSQSFEYAFANSCNCAFYNMGINLKADKIATTAYAFGLGEKILCFDALEEQKGIIPQNSSYGIYEAVNMSIGQGEIMITPVQAANMTAIIANNGVANCVNIADSIVGADGATKRNLRETAERRVISRETALKIQACMRLAVSDGTASGAKSDIVGISGKTGTAQTGWYENGENYVHGWFCGYFPSDNPKYAMAVLCENGKSGSLSAVPVFKKIAEEISKIYPLG